MASAAAAVVSSPPEEPPMKITAGAVGLALLGVNRVLAKPFRRTVCTVGCAGSDHRRARAAVA